MPSTTRSTHSLRILITVACMLTASTYLQAVNVRVFTDQRHPVDAPKGVPVIHLDATAKIEAELASELPADPQRAAAIVRQRLNEGRTDSQVHLASAYQGVIDAWKLGITHIPAVVVDGHYVVYGDTDVTRAMATIEEYKRVQQ